MGPTLNPYAPEFRSFARNACSAAPSSAASTAANARDGKDMNSPNTVGSKVAVPQLPGEVLSTIIACLDNARDALACGLASKQLLEQLEHAEMRLDLSTRLSDTSSAQQATGHVSGLTHTLKKYMPGTVQLDLSNLLADDSDVMALLAHLPRLVSLDLSGCKRLTSGLSDLFGVLADRALEAAALTHARRPGPGSADIHSTGHTGWQLASPTPDAAPAVLGRLHGLRAWSPAAGASMCARSCPAHSAAPTPWSGSAGSYGGPYMRAAGAAALPGRNLRALNLQRCFQLNSGALTQVLRAAGAGVMPLQALALSHLDLAHWPWRQPAAHAGALGLHLSGSWLDQLTAAFDAAGETARQRAAATQLQPGPPGTRAPVALRHSGSEGVRSASRSSFTRSSHEQDVEAGEGEEGAAELEALVGELEVDAESAPPSALAPSRARSGRLLYPACGPPPACLDSGILPCTPSGRQPAVVPVRPAPVERRPSAAWGELRPAVLLSSSWQDQWTPRPAAPRSGGVPVTQLTVVALNNCSQVDVSGLAALAVVCPQLQLLLLGGCTLTHTSLPPRGSLLDSPPALPEPMARLRDSARQRLSAADLPPASATGAPGVASGMAAAASTGPQLLDVAAGVVAVLGSLPSLRALEMTYMPPRLVQLVRLGLGAPPCEERAVAQPNAQPVIVSDTMPADMAADETAVATGVGVQVWDFTTTASVLAATAVMQSASSPHAHCAAQAAPGSGSAQAVRALLQKPAMLQAVALGLQAAVNCSNVARCTPLHTAAEHGDRARCAALLALGADTDRREKGGSTPLFLCCEAGHVACVEVLLAAHADVRLANAAGESPLYIAALRGHLPVVRSLLLHCKAAGIAWQEPRLYSDCWTPLMAAAVADRHDVALALLSAAGLRGAQQLVVSVNRYGQSVLHIAARKGSARLLRLLLSHGGTHCWTVPDTCGDTPADIARKHRNAMGIVEFRQAAGLACLEAAQCGLEAPHMSAMNQSGPFAVSCSPPGSAHAKHLAASSMHAHAATARMAAEPKGPYRQPPMAPSW